jgi:hypothetical protein
VRAAVLFNDVGAVDIDAKLIVGSRVTRSTSPTAASAAPAAMIWWGMLPVSRRPASTGAANTQPAGSAVGENYHMRLRAIARTVAQNVRREDCRLGSVDAHSWQDRTSADCDREKRCDHGRLRVRAGFILQVQRWRWHGLLRHGQGWRRSDRARRMAREIVSMAYQPRPTQAQRAESEMCGPDQCAVFTHNPTKGE